MRTLTAVAVAVLLVAAGAVGPTGVAAQTTAPQVENGCSFPVTETDAMGAEVTVDAEPEAVVVLGPSAAQTMWEIGAESKVTGMPVNQYTADLEGYDEREGVMNADGFTVNVETVVDLDPDVVLAPNIVPDETVETLRESGVTVYKFEAATSIEDVYAKTELTGRLVGECEGARETVEWMQERVDVVERAVEGEEHPGVYLPLGGGVTAGSGTFVGDVVTTAGGQNVAADAGVEFYGELSEEVLLEQNPEWIVIDDGLAYADQPESDVLNRTAAYENDRILVVDANNLSQPAPRVVYALETIVEALHPEAYTEAQASADAGDAGTDPTETDAEAGADGGTEADAEAEADADAEAPGFGGPAAVAAVVAAALFAARRR